MMKKLDEAMNTFDTSMTQVPNIDILVKQNKDSDDNQCRVHVISSIESEEIDRPAQKPDYLNNVQAPLWSFVQTSKSKNAVVEAKEMQGKPRRF